MSLPHIVFRSNLDFEGSNWVPDTLDPYHASIIGHGFLKSVFLASFLSNNNKTEISDLVKKNPFQRIINRWKGITNVLKDAVRFPPPLSLASSQSPSHLFFLYLDYNNFCFENAWRFVDFIESPLIQELIAELRKDNLEVDETILEFDLKPLLENLNDSSADDSIATILNMDLGTTLERRKLEDMSSFKSFDNLEEFFVSQEPPPNLLKPLIWLLQHKSEMLQHDLEQVPEFTLTHLRMLVKCINTTKCFHDSDNTTLLTQHKANSKPKNVEEKLDNSSPNHVGVGTLDETQQPLGRNFFNVIEGDIPLSDDVVDQREPQNIIDHPDFDALLESAFALLEDTEDPTAFEPFLNMFTPNSYQEFHPNQAQPCNQWVSLFTKQLHLMQEKNNMGMVFGFFFDEIMGHPTWPGDENTNARIYVDEVFNKYFDGKNNETSEADTDEYYSSLNDVYDWYKDVAERLLASENDLFIDDRDMEQPMEKTDTYENRVQNIWSNGFDVFALFIDVMELETVGANTLEILKRFVEAGPRHCARQAVMQNVHTSVEHLIHELIHEKKSEVENGVESSFKNIDANTQAKPDEHGTTMNSSRDQSREYRGGKFDNAVIQHSIRKLSEMFNSSGTEQNENWRLLEGFSTLIDYNFLHPGKKSNCN